MPPDSNSQLLDPPTTRTGESDSLRSLRPPDDARVGTTVGKHRVLRVLGRGGMGVVYEAEHVLLKRRAAVKILPESLSADAESAGRFLREAQAAARLNHPNTVAVYEVGRQDGLLFIVMELVRGGSAADFLQARGPFRWPDATRIIADACRGLAAAHDAGLLHRDIKPANIMRSKENGVVKLADFGLAKCAGTSAVSLTGSGNLVGTPQYMSPEQCRAQPLDARSDVYSLGVTYYALLAGDAPFAEARDIPQVMFAHCFEPLPDPRRVRADVDERCVAILRKATAKDPADRYPTAKAMLADLEWLLAAGSGDDRAARRQTSGWMAFLQSRRNTLPPGTGMSSVPSPSGSRPVGPGRRLLRILIGAAGALALGTAIGVGLWAAGFGARPQPGDAHAPSKKPSAVVTTPPVEPPPPKAPPDRTPPDRTPPDRSPAGPGASAVTFTPARRFEDLRRHVGEPLTAEFTVRSCGGKTNIYLNSETNFMASGNFAVRIAKPALEKFRDRGITDVGRHFEGKTIRAVGKVGWNEQGNKPQLEIDGPDDIRIVK
jgi:serine/threonine protein kinase